MGMPIDLVFVRHGHSEQNEFEGRDKKQIPHTAQYIAVKKRLDADQRLTPKGVEQAVAAGQWLKQERSRPIRRRIRFYLYPRHGNRRASRPRAKNRLVSRRPHR